MILFCPSIFKSVHPTNSHRFAVLRWFLMIHHRHKDPPKRSQPKSSVRSGHHKPSKQSSQYRHSPPAGSWLSKNLAKPRRLELCKYSFTIPPSSSESPRQRSTGVLHNLIRPLKGAHILVQALSSFRGLSFTCRIVFEQAKGRSLWQS